MSNAAVQILPSCDAGVEHIVLQLIVWFWVLT
jgi:hypothetical protein